MLPLCYAAPPPPPLAEKSLSAAMKVPGLKTNIRLTKLAQEISWCVRDIQTFFVKMIEADFFSLNLKGNRSRVPGPGNGRCLLFRRIGKKVSAGPNFCFPSVCLTSSESPEVDFLRPNVASRSVVAISNLFSFETVMVLVIDANQKIGHSVNLSELYSLSPELFEQAKKFAKIHPRTVQPVTHCQNRFYNL